MLIKPLYLLGEVYKKGLVNPKMVNIFKKVAVQGNTKIHLTLKNLITYHFKPFRYCHTYTLFPEGHLGPYPYLYIHINYLSKKITKTAIFILIVTVATCQI